MAGAADRAREPGGNGGGSSGGSAGHGADVSVDESYVDAARGAGIEDEDDDDEDDFEKYLHELSGSDEQEEVGASWDSSGETG